MPGLRNIERAARLCRHGHDGPAEEPDSDCEINQDKKTHQTPGPVPADKQDALLQAIRALSSQVSPRLGWRERRDGIARND